MNSNNNEDKNKEIENDLFIDNSDNENDSDENYDDLYNEPEEAFAVVNVLSQVYSENNKTANINTRYIQEILDNNQLEAIDEEMLLDNVKNNIDNNIGKNNNINNENNNKNGLRQNSTNLNISLNMNSSSHSINSFNANMSMQLNHSTNINASSHSNHLINSNIHSNPSMNVNNSSNSNNVNVSSYANHSLNANSSFHSNYNNSDNEMSTIESMKRKISELQESYDNLKEKNKELINEKYIKEGEISVIRKRIKAMEQKNNQLTVEMINKTKAIEDEKLQEREKFKSEINRLQTELQFKKQEINELGLARSYNINVKKENKVKIKTELDPQNDEFPTQASFISIPENFKASIYTNKSKFLKELENSNNENINNKNSPKKEIINKIMKSDISVQTIDSYPNQSRISTLKYQLPIPNSRFLFIQRLYNINIYSKLIEYIGATNTKQNIYYTQNHIYITIKKLLSYINDIIANSSIPIINLISPLEEFMALSLESKNLKMALTGLKLLFNIILNDNESKNYLLMYPIKVIIKIIIR